MVEVIDTLKPKNNGDFPVAEASDISVGNQRLPEVIDSLASSEDLASVAENVRTKADKTEVADIKSEISDKTDESDFVSFKTETNNKTTSLQNQINNIVSPVTQDAEVQNARIGTDGSNYATLGERLNNEIGSLQNSVGKKISTWEIGTISASTGEDGYGNTRLRIVGFIPISSFGVFTYTYGIPAFFLYDKDKAFIEGSGWINESLLSKNYIENFVAQYPEAKYIRFIWKKPDESVVNLTDVTLYDIAVFSNGALSSAVESESRLKEITDDITKLNTSWISGKKVSIIGDSISTYDMHGYKIDGYAMKYPFADVTDIRDAWWYRVIRSSGAVIEVNASYSGSRVTDSTAPNFYDRTNILGEPDVIFVVLGVNDSRNGVPLGDFDYENLNPETNKFRPAYIKGVKALISNYPNAQIICLALNMGEDFTSSIKAIAEHYNCIYISATGYNTADNVHPNVMGMKSIAEKIINRNIYDLETELAPAKSLITILRNITKSDIEQGVWENGKKAESERRIRTKEKMLIEVGSEISINTNGLYVLIRQYESEYESESKESSGWIIGNEILITKYPYITMIFANSDDFSTSTKISPDDYVCQVQIARLTSVYYNTEKINQIYDILGNEPPGWEMGTISGQTGAEADSTTRVRTSKFIEIDKFNLISWSNGTVAAICYDSDLKFLTSSGWLPYAESKLTAEKIKKLDENTSYIKLLWQNKEQTISVDDIEANNVSIVMSGLKNDVYNVIIPKLSEVDLIKSSLQSNILKYAYKISHHYCYGDGRIDTSTKWNTYWIETKSFNLIAEIMSHTNDASYFQVAFYSSSEIINDSTFVGGMRFSEIGEHYAYNITIPENAVVCLIFNRFITDTSVFAYGMQKEPIMSIENSISELKSKSDLSSGYTYNGERIKINTNYFDFNSLGVSASGQDACIYNNTLVSFSADKKCKFTDLINLNDITTITLGGDAAPHCNSAVFSNAFFDDNDEYPLVYINAYNSADLPLGTVYVHRIITDDTGIPVSTSLIQTIKIGFTTDEIWTDGGDLRPYGNFFVDTSNGFLYAYTLKDNEKITRFFKFKIPNVNDENVILSKNDIIEYFDTDYIPYIQGNTFNGGKAYILSGFGNNEYHGKLYVVSLASKSIVSMIDFNEAIGATWEPEFIDVYKNKLILGSSNAYEFIF